MGAGDLNTRHILCSTLPVPLVNTKVVILAT
jgi:hypothetical protein